MKKYGPYKVDSECLVCGTPFRTWKNNILSGHTKSCGCLEISKPNARTHGMSRTGTYKSWTEMRYRCTNPRSSSYSDYGGRGITIDPEWNTFESFYRDMGKRPNNKSLGRVNNNAGYGFWNCRWETAVQQNNNRRKFNV